MRRAVGLSTVVLALGLQLACGGGSSSAPEGAAPPAEGAGRTRDTLVVATQADFANLNPAVAESASDSEVIGNVYFGNYDATFDCKIAFRPGLYQSWAFTEDGTLLTVHLRDDIKWSDGQPVTAHDVVFLYDLIRDPAVASPRLANTENMVAGWPKALDDATVEFKFTHAYDQDTMLSHAGSLPAVPKHAFADADRATLRGHPRSIDPLSSGPWRLKLHEKGSRFVLEPNPNFTGPESFRPKLNRVVFTIIPEYATRLIQLTSGAVDLMEGINVEDVDRLRAEHPEIDIVSRGYRTMDFIGWNNEFPLFADPEVRTALTLAIDVDGMIAKLLTGKDGTSYAKKAVGTLTPALCALSDTSLQPLPHDPARARQILASKGWNDTNADGVLDKDGKPFTFTLATNTGNKRRADASILIQAALKEIGVQVQLEQRETNTFFESLRKRDYEAALSGWSAALYVDPTPMWHCDAPGKRMEFNQTGYCNKEVDALIEKGMSTPDPAVSAPIWRELQAKIYADQPYTFLWWREELVGVSSRFSHREIDILSSLDHLWTWEVPADKVKYAR